MNDEGWSELVQGYTQEGFDVELSNRYSTYGPDDILHGQERGVIIDDNALAYAKQGIRDALGMLEVEYGAAIAEQNADAILNLADMRGELRNALNYLNNNSLGDVYVNETTKGGQVLTRSVHFE